MEGFYRTFFIVLILLVSDVHVNGGNDLAGLLLGNMYVYVPLIRRYVICFDSALLVKTSEAGQRSIHGVYCGQQIKNVYVIVCALARRIKRKCAAPVFSILSWGRPLGQNAFGRRTK